MAVEHRGLLRLWLDTYTRSLIDPEGPWADFAAATVREWLDLFTDLTVGQDDVDRTLLLAVLRGSLIDLLATHDIDRTTAAVDRYLASTQETPPAASTTGNVTNAAAPSKAATNTPV